mmetsp:Transcript_50877/g.121667  ORF Transcript_50877/g.121667 Transcript_50877/m.121667 type:complete len:215 (+) Transcript_50877:1048-1692(+)
MLLPPLCWLRTSRALLPLSPSEWSARGQLLRNQLLLWQTTFAPPPIGSSAFAALRHLRTFLLQSSVVLLRAPEPSHPARVSAPRFAPRCQTPWPGRTGTRRASSGACCSPRPHSSARPRGRRSLLWIAPDPVGSGLASLAARWPGRPPQAVDWRSSPPVASPNLRTAPSWPGALWTAPRCPPSLSEVAAFPPPTSPRGRRSPPPLPSSCRCPHS